MELRNSSRILLLTVVLVVLSAGCLGLLGPEEATERPATPTPGSTADRQTATGSATSASTPSTTPTPASVDPANPFEQRTVPVVLRDTVEDRDMRPIATRALEYWEDNSEQYAGYPIEFTLVEDGADHRMEIEFASAPISCGRTIDTRTTGCANFNTETAPAVTTVTVARNYTDRYTYETMVHELGHALGVDHGEEPVEFMAEESPTGIARDTVRVAVTGPDSAAAKRSEVAEALTYFESHPDLDETDRLDWEMTDDADQADLVIAFRDGGCFADSSGSCSGDPQFEDQQMLVLDSLDTEVVAWHTAFQLAPAFFDSERPEALSAATSRRERERWDG